MKKPRTPFTYVPVPRELLRRFSKPLTQDQQHESAVPSYLHSNPFVRWMITKRLKVIALFAGEILAGLDLKSAPSALDFGCGVGPLIPTLTKHLGNLYVTDLVLDGARLMADHFGAGNVVFMNPEDWPVMLPDQSLALVIAADVLEHVDDLEGIITLIHRKLLHGGSLIVSGPTETFIYGLARRVAGFSGDYHVRTIFDIEKRIQEAGFRPTSRKKLPFPVLPKLFRITHYVKDPER